MASRTTNGTERVVKKVIAKESKAVKAKKITHKTKTSLDLLREKIKNKNTHKVVIGLHAFPDLDCMGASLGFIKLIKEWKPEIEYVVVYSGSISHPQNVTTSNLLNIKMTHLDVVENLKELGDCFVAIDGPKERCFGNEDIDCFMVIDHHEDNSKADIEVKDIRDVGATCSIIYDYISKEKIKFDKEDDFDSDVATGMAMGIRSDTLELVSENVTFLDYDAYQFLMNFSSRKHMQSITNYPIPSYLFKIRGRLEQEENIHIEDGAFVGGLGILSPSQRDSIPVMADERVRCEGVDTSFIFAIVDDKIDMSIRSSNPSFNVEEYCEKIYKEYGGSGGGKKRAGIGSACLDLGFLSPTEFEESTQVKIWHAVRDAMFEKIRKIVSRS